MFEDVPYVCCDKTFKTLYELFDHKDTHAEEDKLLNSQKPAPPPDDSNSSIPTDLLMKKVFTCTYCSKSYASHSGLKNHLTKVHNKTMG